MNRKFELKQFIDRKISDFDARISNCIKCDRVEFFSDFPFRGNSEI